MDSSPFLRSKAECAPSDRSGPIALGVLLDGRIQEAWVRESVRRALAVPGVDLVAAVILHGRARASFASRLHGLLDRLDERLRCPDEDLFVPVDVAAELGVRPMEIEVALHPETWSLDAAAAAAMRRCRVDVWLCFTAVPPRRPLRRVSPLGVWGIEIGRQASATNAWAGAAEVSARSPVTMTSVVDYAEPGEGVLYRSFGATLQNSVRRNRLGCLRKGMSFFGRLLAGLTRAEGARPRDGPATLALPPAYPAVPAPSPSAVVRLSWRLVAHVAANQWRRLRRFDQWQIGYYFADEDEAPCRFDRMRYLEVPRDRFWADPFAVEHRGRTFIFFEEWPFRTRRARIVAIEVFEHAEPGEPQVVLERPYHLSYPFVFEWEGSLYLLPETAENRTVELYRCEAFPHRWRRIRTLLRGISAYDATLWREDDRWWMFVNVAEPGADSSDELHLYWSATPLGPWTAHRGNPVVSDVRSARPAGPLFSRGGERYRPSQDCSLAYGHSVSINRVDVLREDEYRETAVNRIAPGWRKDILRVHTLGASGRLRVIDCLSSRKRGFASGGV